MIQAVGKMADGDFNIEIEDLPGKKIILSRSIREISAKLNDLYVSVTELAEKASKGDLSAQVDVSRLKGNWVSMANKLNDLVNAVAAPLADIEHNVEIMAQGDFSHLEGEYPGTFGRLQRACNINNDITMAYINEISQVLQSMAKGDLTVELKLRYLGSYDMSQ